MRNMNTVCAMKRKPQEKSWVNEYFSEVSPVIRCLIPKTAFWVDFLIPISPNSKKVFKIVGNAS